MNPTSSTPLTEGQQGVLRMYDSEINHCKVQLADARRAFMSGFGDYEEIRYQTEKIEELEAERAMVLGTYLGN